MYSHSQMRKEELFSAVFLVWKFFLSGLPITGHRTRTPPEPRDLRMAKFLSPGQQRTLPSHPLQPRHATRATWLPLASFRGTSCWRVAFSCLLLLLRTLASSVPNRHWFLSTLRNPKLPEPTTFLPSLLFLSISSRAADGAPQPDPRGRRRHGRRACCGRGGQAAARRHDAATGGGRHGTSRQQRRRGRGLCPRLEMKTDRIRTDITDIIFLFIFLIGFGFEYG